MSVFQILDPLRLPLSGTRLIEASAGTGKTWTIAALYLRLVLGHGREAPLLPSQMLVMTFTKAATAELRERIRTRLTEAAAAFRGEGTPDPFLSSLVADYAAELRATAARRLDLAAQWMDEAAVFTIHGWCQRMLTQHAFDSGEAIGEAGIADDAALRAEAVRDYWRHYVAPLDTAGAGWIDAVWASPDLLARAVAPLLPLPPGGLLAGGAAIAPIDDPLAYAGAIGADLHDAEIDARRTWAAHADALDALLTTSVQARVLSGSKLPARYLPGHLQAMRAWANGAPADEEVLARFAQRRIDACANQGMAAPVHAAFAAVERLLDAMAAAGPLHTRLLAHAAAWIAQHEDATRRTRGLLGYDDMLRRLAAALHGANGDALAATIARQYPVALIDEFQDTDRLQWSSLERIYVDRPASTLLLIGDPKQAIYGFRGADIQAYFHARGKALAPTWTLPNNFRSTAPLVAAVNRVFTHADTHADGAFSFGKQLAFAPVAAAGRRETFTLDGMPVPALQLALSTATPVPASGAWRERMAAHAAAQIVAWLNAAQAGRCGFTRADGGFDALAAGDIAILVRDKADAAAMHVALHHRGLAHVYLSDRQSVYASAEAADLVHWLVACAQPDADGALRAALATPSMARSLTELDRLNTDEAFRESCDGHLRALHEQWQRHGVLAMVHDLLHRFDVPARLLATAHGERALTNLLQLAELLQQAAVTLDGAQALIRFLVTQIDNPASGEAAEAQLVRLESEAALVKIVTVHKSKGLEYPVVLLPFVCGSHEPDRNRAAPRRDAQGIRQLDLAPEAEVWPDVVREQRQEDLRLLYVALTRARHACWLGVGHLKYGKGDGQTSDLGKSAFGYVLSGDPESTPDRLPAQLAALCDDSPAIAIRELPDAAAETPYIATPPPAARRAARRCHLPPRLPWWIASYSALARTDGDHTAHAPPETAAQATLVEPGAGIEADAAPRAADDRSIHAFPRGAAPGTFLHELLESCAHIGFAHAAQGSTAQREAIAWRCRHHGLAAWADPLARWLPALLRAPLPLPDGGEMSLQALTDPGRYRAELEFWFEAHQVDSRALDRLVTAQTLDAAPRPMLAHNQVNGMLKGFIDLAFEHAGRWYVADYKSNWLGNAAAAYTPEAMRASVLKSRYDLQYTLYTLALHRQLAARLPDYDYDRHMGGVLYLYLRGVDGAGHGVHAARLPRALIETLDAWFAGRTGMEPVA